jgi:hypothetical protein
MDRIGGDVQRELKRFGPQAGMTELLAAWPGAVGEAISRNAWPSRVARDGTLQVAVASSSWAFELAQLAPTILDRLTAALGDLAPKGLKFAPGPIPEAISDPDPVHRRPPALPTPEQEAEAAALATAIDDANLREVVAKTAALSLARAAHDRSV